MASLFRGKPRRPEFVVPPAESREAHAQAAEVEEVDRQIRAIAMIPAAARGPQEWSNLDVLLDRRNRLRLPQVTSPADVPFTPGPTS